jgi:serine protease Do
MRFLVLIGLCALSYWQLPGQMIRAGAGSYIGVGMLEVDSERAKALKLHDTSGLEITVVEQDSPADKAGLKSGDVILRYNGQKVEGTDQFSRMVRETPAGREVKFDIVRGGMPQTVVVRVAQRKTPKMEWSDAPMTAAFPFDIHMPEVQRMFMTFRSSALGIEAESIDGQLAQYFGVKDGALVRNVTKGSAAEKGGMRAGDVIQRIEDTHIATPADISSRLRSVRGKPTPMVVMRDHKELTLTVTVTEDDPAGRIEITPFQVHQPN